MIAAPVLSQRLAGQDDRLLLFGRGAFRFHGTRALGRRARHLGAAGILGLGEPAIAEAAPARAPAPAVILLALFARRIGIGWCGGLRRGARRFGLRRGGRRGNAFYLSRRCAQPRLLLQARHRLFHAGDDFVVFLAVFKEVGNVQEGVAVQPDIDECRLHAGQDAFHPALIDRAGYGVFLGPLVVNLSQLVVFEDGDLRLVERRGND